MVNNIFECFLTKFEKTISYWLPIVRLVTLGPAFLVPVLLFKLVQVSEVKEKNLIVSDVKENFNNFKSQGYNELNGERLTKIVSIDYYLLIFLNFDFGTQIKQTDKLKASVVDFIKNIHDFLIDYEKDLLKIKTVYLAETQELIEKAKQSLTELNFFSKIFSGNKSILQKLCEDILNKEQLMGWEIRNLNKKIQQKILQEIEKIEKSNEMTKELSNTCSKLFNLFSDKQNLCTEQSQFKSLRESFYNILGIELSLAFQTKAGMASSILGVVILGGDVFTLVGLALAGGFFGGGMLLIVAKKCEIENTFSNIFNVQNNLNRLKELQISRIDGVCESFISNNNQTISCLKNLFNRLVL